MPKLRFFSHIQILQTINFIEFGVFYILFKWSCIKNYLKYLKIFWQNSIKIFYFLMNKEKEEYLFK